MNVEKVDEAYTLQDIGATTKEIQQEVAKLKNIVIRIAKSVGMELKD